MPYPEELVAPMREELTRLGVAELRTPELVDAAMENSGTNLFIINSVCGCAAANARPAITLASQYPVQPDNMFTVFAGQDLEATAQLRTYLLGIPPSSPFMALVKDGEPVFVIERRAIEGRTAQAIAADLVYAYDKYCGETAAETTTFETPVVATEDKGLPSTFKSIL